MLALKIISLTLNDIKRIAQSAGVVEYTDCTPPMSVLDMTLNSGGGVRGVMAIVVGNGHGDTSSNPGRDWLHFT